MMTGQVPKEIRLDGNHKLDEIGLLRGCDVELSKFIDPEGLVVILFSIETYGDYTTIIEDMHTMANNLVKKGPIPNIEYMGSHNFIPSLIFHRKYDKRCKNY
jgi:hypothetical protein